VGLINTERPDMRFEMLMEYNWQEKQQKSIKGWKAFQSQIVIGGTNGRYGDYGRDWSCSRRY